MQISDIFSSVESPDYAVSQFNGNHSIKTTLTLGKVTPTKTIIYRPGDKFRMNAHTTLDFVPLLSPNYQRYTLKEYLFKVRKGLTWFNDDFGKFLLAGADGSTPPVMPFMPTDSFYYFGDAVINFKFNPHRPVYGLIDAGSNIGFQVTDLPSDCLNNDLINFSTLSDDQYVSLLNNLRDAWTFEVSYRNKRPSVLDAPRMQHLDRQFTHSEVKPAWDFNNLVLNGSTLEPRVFLAAAPTFSQNNVTFANLGPVGDSFFGVYHTHTPLYRNSELVEALGYPTFNFDVQHCDYVELFKQLWNDFIDSCITRRQSDPTMNFPWTKPDTQFDYLVINPNSHSSDHVPTIATVSTLIQSFCQYAISHGHGDGTECDDFVFTSVPLKDIFVPPVDKAGNNPRLDLGPLSSFWLIWSEYFIDSTQMAPIGIIKESGRYLDGSNLLSVIDDFYIDKSYFNWLVGFDGEYLENNYVNGSLSANDLYYFKRLIMLNELLVNYTSIPSKGIDRNYFTSALPDITKVKVFAPVIPSLPSDGVVPKMDTPTDIQPSQSVDPTTSFLSIEAFRTAQVLENFFVNSMLAGPRPVQFILMHFGEHSKDFRMEIPTLVNATEQSISSRSVTQSAETSELPLGYEASKLSIVKDSGFDVVDAEGDHGYIIRLVCVYPEVLEIGGANRELLCGSPYDWIMFPAFGKLGEQPILSYEVDSQPIDISDALWYNGVDRNAALAGLVAGGKTSFEEFGYTPRYGNLKHISSESHGRFLTDLDYWDLDRIKRPTSFYNGYEPLRLSPQFLRIPVDNRQMVDSEVNNIKMYQFVECEFTRKLPLINPTKLL